MGTFDCLVDEEGIPKRLPENRPIQGRLGVIMVRGPIVVTKLRNGGDGLASLTVAEAEQIAKEMAS